MSENTPGEPRDAGGSKRLTIATFVRMAAIDTGPLRRHRDFRLLWVGQGVSSFGTAITQVALPFQIYRLTHSSFAVGLIGLCEIIPILALAFLGGALADAHDRRRLVLLTEVGLAGISGLLIVNALVPTPQVWLLYLAAAVAAGLSAVQGPSLGAMLPRLVEREEIPSAAALNSLRGTAASVLGPALGGALIAVLGLALTYGVDLLTFSVSLAALSMMRGIPPPPEAERPSLRRIVEGLRYARSRPELMGTYLVDMAAMFFGMPMALFPAIATRYGGATVLGLLYAAPAAGSFLAALTSGWSRHVHRHGWAVILAASIWGVAIVAFGVSPTLPLALAALAVAGGADMISGIFRSAIWNQTIPDALRGRLAGIEMVSYTTGPAFGDLEAGTIASLFSVRASIVSGGILCVVATALLALALAGFRRYDARSHVLSSPTEAPSCVW